MLLLYIVGVFHISDACASQNASEKVGDGPACTHAVGATLGRRLVGNVVAHPFYVILSQLF